MVIASVPSQSVYPAAYMKGAMVPRWLPSHGSGSVRAGRIRADRGSGRPWFRTAVVQASRVRRKACVRVASAPLPYPPAMKSVTPAVGQGADLGADRVLVTHDRHVARARRRLPGRAWPGRTAADRRSRTAGAALTTRAVRDRSVTQTGSRQTTLGAGRPAAAAASVMTGTTSGPGRRGGHCSARSGRCSPPARSTRSRANRRGPRSRRRHRSLSGAGMRARHGATRHSLLRLPPTRSPAAVRSTGSAGSTRFAVAPGRVDIQLRRHPERRRPVVQFVGGLDADRRDRR